MSCCVCRREWDVLPKLTIEPAPRHEEPHAASPWPYFCVMLRAEQRDLSDPDRLAGVRDFLAGYA